MLYTVTIPSSIVKGIISSLRRVAMDGAQAQRESRAALSFIKLEVIPRGRYVELVASACNGYVAAKLRVESDMTNATEPFVTYFQPFPYRPGRANVTKLPVTFTFDSDKKESSATLTTMTGKITYTYDCKSVVDDFVRMDKTLEGLYAANNSAKKAVHYVDPGLLKGAILSAAEIYRKSVKVAIPEGETAPIEVVSVFSSEDMPNSNFTLLQLPIRGLDY